MKDKVSQNKKCLNFSKRQGSYVTILPTDTIVERIKMGQVEKIHVIDPIIVEPPKKPFFFINLNPFRRGKKDNA